ncbi:MAG: hypothetical protein QXE55_06505 [Saccharolobus sp.]
MNYKIIIIVVAIAVILIIGGLILFEHAIMPSQTVISKVVFPTQDQLSSVLGNNWNITELYEENYSSAVNQQYPGGTVLYQEYVQRDNQTIVISVLQLSNSSTSIKGIKVGNYLVFANVSSNSTQINLNSIEELEVSTLKSGKGLMPTVNPLLIVPMSNVTILQFGNATTSNYTIYFQTLLYNNSYVTIDLAKSSNISSLFNYLLLTAGKNVTVSTINGAKYFNLSLQTYYGSVYYYVGVKDNYLIFIQSQTPQAFQLFLLIVNRV